MIEKIAIRDKFNLFSEPWSPKIIAELNGQHVKLVRLAGEFEWHLHEHEDELFLVVDGVLRILFRDQELILGPGELCVIPRGVEHKPVADEEVQALLFEPAGTLNTGNMRSGRTKDRLEWI